MNKISFFIIFSIASISCSNLRNLYIIEENLYNAITKERDAVDKNDLVVATIGYKQFFHQIHELSKIIVQEGIEAKNFEQFYQSLEELMYLEGELKQKTKLAFADVQTANSETWRYIEIFNNNNYIANFYTIYIQYDEKMNVFNTVILKLKFNSFFEKELCYINVSKSKNGDKFVKQETNYLHDLNKMDISFFPVLFIYCSEIRYNTFKGMIE